ncbi:alpha/beta hydrolase family protein [Chitinilyticum litopenaei]|uniref:alpha/beta hydrolase family protein n=1 Tax=Chitinilyticum litopenaei TaxID=1121276 RepID=UPI00040EC5F4|nr:alpha/beta fold hydrolase [Chitinilyticum litopenaei]
MSRLARCCIATLLALPFALSACGGGSDQPATSKPTPTPTAIPVTPTPTPSPLPQVLLRVDNYSKAGELGAGSSQLLRYRKPAIRGGDTEANTLLFTPKGTAPAGGWPLVVWAHGTTGVADACAPSRDFALDQDRDMVAALLQAGFAVLAPDYEGLDAPGIHPYLSLDSQGRSITHAVLAAHEVIDTRFTRFAPGWAVIGHSQGGFAALAAAQHASALRERYPLRATVALAPGSDLVLTVSELFAKLDQLQAAHDSKPSEATLDALGEAVFTTAYNGTMLAHGLASQNPAIGVAQVVDPRFLPIAALAAEQRYCLDERNEFVGALQQDLVRHLQAGGKLASYPSLRRDLLDNTVILQQLERNRPGQVKLDGPILMVQGTEDTQTPVQAARVLAKTMQSLGSQVQYVEAPGGDHGSILLSHRAQAIDFLRQQLLATK